MHLYWKQICAALVCGATMLGAPDAFAAAKSSSTKSGKQSAIQKGTSVRTQTQATGLYDQACYDAYYGCMDQFCIADNTNGGSCSCSDDSAKYEKQFAEIQSILEEAARIRTEEVEKVKAGADADIVFSGTRKYDENGNILAAGELTQAEKKKKAIEDLFNSTLYDDEDEEGDVFSSIGNIGDKTGAELYSAAQQICEVQVPDNCAKDLPFLTQMYSRQIASDCKGFENTLATKMAAAKQELTAAQGEVRTALKESFESANKYDLGTCMVEFKKCMQTKDACDSDWGNCVGTIASENMQNNAAVSTAKTKVATVNKYDITDSTMEILDSKRIICEKVLDQCVAVRDQVWPAFLREAAPTIKIAESKVESKFRQSCLNSISTCIQNACKDDIVGKGTATMDACLSRPDMARSFCKVEIDPCERMEPLIWGYVVDKLAAMRVDACTQEVKDCFTADTRCGADFSNCIGMDYNYIHDICPVDSLVVCKANNPKFSMDDLDSMLMGLYLNIDNSAMEQCQNLVDEKMAEICGSTTDCNKFAADDTIGTGSLRSQKDGTTYRVTGMISFGSIKMGDASGKTVEKIGEKETVLAPGEIGVDSYMAEVRTRNAGVANAEGIFSSIEEELNNIAGTINRTITMIEQDPKIQFCVNGRDLSQITGAAGAKTSARFPNLLNQVKMQIAVAALRKAQDNYNAKLNEAISEATKNASADIAQYMCQKIAENGGSGGSGVEASTPLVAPYSISYDVGAGLTAEELTKGGAGVISTKGVTFNTGRYLGAGSLDSGGTNKTVRAVFSRDTRICHICSQTTSQDCKTSGSVSWFHNNRKVDCKTNVGEEICEDITM